MRSVRLGGASLVMVMLMLPSAALARDIDWDRLNLSPQQENQIGRYEDNWEKTHDQISSQIERDTAELKAILPTGDSQRIRFLQSRITQNKMYLLNQSMDTFLKKRDALSPAQRQQLQKMMPGRD